MSELEWTRDADGVGGWSVEHGGGSPVIARAIYDDTVGVTAAKNARVALPWVLNSGDTLLDLSVPTLPTVIAAGVYAVTATVNLAVGPVVQIGIEVDLEMDTDNEDADTLCHFIVGPPGYGTYCAVTSVYYVPAGGLITIHARHNSDDDQVFRVNQVVQRVS